MKWWDRKDTQKVPEKMLNTTNIREMHHQNHNEMLPYTCKNGCYQKDKK